MYKTKEVKPDKHVNLLMISQGENRHYCLIRNFSRLMGYRTKHKCGQFYCYNCLHGFSRQSLLDAHSELCFKQKTQAIKFPEKLEEKEVMLRTRRGNCLCHSSSMQTSNATHRKSTSPNMETQQSTRGMFLQDSAI